MTLPWRLGRVPCTLTLAGTLGLACLLYRPILARISPELAFDSAIALETADVAGTAARLDPWGRPYYYIRSGKGAGTYSAGPNGTPEAGGGDDLRFDPARSLQVGRYVAGLLQEWLAYAALLVLWFGWGPGVRSPRSEKLRVECGRALTASLLPGLLWILVLDRLSRFPRNAAQGFGNEFVESISRMLTSPHATVMLVATGWAGLFTAALCCRLYLVRPPEPTGEREHLERG